MTIIDPIGAVGQFDRPRKIQMRQYTKNGEERFDLRPSPRILQMLGEINLDQWRCLAELVDNSVDGFLKAQRQASPIMEPEVSIALPTRDSATAAVTVIDNGPGMSHKELAMAVSAGWSGNNPIDSLGMFGMGFNIATARLGTVTTVWTTRSADAEWNGLRIDFGELQKQGHFLTPHLTKPKTDPIEHGTEVQIEKLKPDQRTWLAKTANRTKAYKELSRTYGAMLRKDGEPIEFCLKLNGNRVPAHQPCIWDDDRRVQTSQGPVRAYQVVDTKLPDRNFCSKCWGWLKVGEKECASCREEGEVVVRIRRVKGWLGIQRYLHKSEYGIDFLRNGRKIELGSKELFLWKSDSEEDLEYPIDDPRSRGRIVGEIHIDHCRVNYTKDRFDRNDPAWFEMLEIVRGGGPLRPKIASDLGLPVNMSPLGILFKAFRRSNPSSSAAGNWGRILVVKDNDIARNMAKKFHSLESEYLDDSKWWEIVEEQDKALLVGDRKGSVGNTKAPIPGFGEDSSGEDGGEAGIKPDGNLPVTKSVPKRRALHQLSQDYRVLSSGLNWDVCAWEVASSDPALESPSAPWALTRTPRGAWNFFVNCQHHIFMSATLTPVDALLAQLAWEASDYNRGLKDAVSFAGVLSELRTVYAKFSALDADLLEIEAKARLRSIALSLKQNIDAEDGKALFEEMLQSDKETAIQRMAQKSIVDTKKQIESAGVFIHAPWDSLRDCFLRHPDLFFDGKCWENEYENLDLGYEKVTQKAKRDIVEYYGGLLADAIWLAAQDVGDLPDTDRSRILRASIALELLEPTNPVNSDDD